MGEDDKAIGRLEAQVENVVKAVETGNREASRHRQAIRSELNTLNNRVSPLAHEVKEMGKRVTQQGAILERYERQRLEIQGAARVGKWFFRGLWAIISGLLILWADHVKLPFIRLLELFR